MDDKKKDGRRQRMQQKRCKWVNGDGLPGGKAVHVGVRREMGHSVQQANGKRVVY